MYLYFIGKPRIEVSDLTDALKLNKLMLNEDNDLKVYHFKRGKLLTKDSVLTIYSVAEYYKLASLSKLSLNYIERCFQIVVENQNYLHLDFSIVAKILNSSELNIHSEVEIFNAIIAWLEHNSVVRIKYAKKLLLRVQISLVSKHALSHILDKTSLFIKNGKLNSECFNTMKEVLLRKNKLYSDNHTNRHCNQKKFNILICGGFRLVAFTSKWTFEANTNVIDGSNLKHLKFLPLMEKERKDFKAVCLKGEVYAFGGRNKLSNSPESFVTVVEKYSPSTNKWSKVADMFDNRKRFCACAFMDKIFIVGGCFYDGDFAITNSCLEFNTKDESWKVVSKMNVGREYAACAVFQGKIVVSGGSDINRHDLKSVESYDAFADEWSRMPNMIESKYNHCSVVVKDKLFVIGRKSCEMFDSFCKKFVAVKVPLYTNCCKSVAIGNKIVVFQEQRSFVFCYDVDKKRWSKEPCAETKCLNSFSYVKLPWY